MIFRMQLYCLPIVRFVDSALVSVLGYVELLKASQILITRTQEPFLILTIAGAFYFALSYPISRYSASLEKRWAQ